MEEQVSYYEDTPEKFWLVHDFVKQNPLYEAVHAVKRFLRLTQEPVILDFHRFAIKSNLPKLFRFPFGFDGDDQAARHEDLVRYLQEELGEFMAPDWMGRNRQAASPEQTIKLNKPTGRQPSTISGT